MKVIYTAGAFRGADSWQMENNIRRAEEIAIEIWRLGAVPECPHTQNRFFQGTLPDKVFIEGTLEKLRRCDICFMIPGWENSVGAKGERDFAFLHGIPVVYRLEELREWLMMGG
jgi:hypothetical protein